MDELWVIRAGLVGYQEAGAMQAALEGARGAGEVPDLVLMLEHPPVYTKGRRSTPAELPMGEDWYLMQGIEIVETDRGGQLTYHGPGQLVAYPIVNLRELRPADLDPPAREAKEATGIGVVDFVRRMEMAMISAIADRGVEASVIEGLTGVWVGTGPPPGGDARKIGSIGIHVRKAITTHGLAINVANDLQPFEWVVPCGIEGCRMTSLSRELGIRQEVDEFATTMAKRLGDVYGRKPVEKPVDAVLGSLPLAVR